MAKYLGESAKDQITKCASISQMLNKYYAVNKLVSAMNRQDLESSINDISKDIAKYFQFTSSLYEFLKGNELMTDGEISPKVSFSFCLHVSDTFFYYRDFISSLNDLLKSKRYDVPEVRNYSEVVWDVRDVEILGSRVKAHQYLIFKNTDEIKLKEGALIIAPHIFFLNSEPEISIDETSAMIAKEYHYSTDADFCEYSYLSDEIIKFCNEQNLHSEL